MRLDELAEPKALSKLREAPDDGRLYVRKKFFTHDTRFPIGIKGSQNNV